jgi:hypothetical protein
LTTSRTDSDLYAVSLFLTNLSIPVARWPPGLAAFIGRHLLFHGHSSLTAESLARAFQRERGLRWYFIRSIINIDPTPLAEYPLVRAEFTDLPSAVPLIEEFLRKNGPAITLEIWNLLFSTIVSVLLRPPIGAPYMLFPVTHTVLATLPPAPPRPQLIAIDAGLVQLLLASKMHRAVPASFFCLFFHLASDPTPGQLIRPVFGPKSETGKAFLQAEMPASYFTEREPVLDEDAIDHFNNRPPSFTLAFVRSLVGLFAQPLPKALVSAIAAILTPVFPEFGFPGCPIWGSAQLETRIIRGWLCQDAVAAIAHPNRWAIGVYHSLMHNPKFRDRDDATRALLTVAVGEGATVNFASRACQAVLAYETDIVGIISTPEFLNAARFANVLVIAVRVARTFGLPALLEALAPHVEDERKRAVFFSGEMAAAVLALS